MEIPNFLQSSMAKKIKKARSKNKQSSKTARKSIIKKKPQPPTK